MFVFWRDLDARRVYSEAIKHDDYWNSILAIRRPTHVDPFRIHEPVRSLSNTMIHLRTFTEADLPAIASLFTASVHDLGAAHYDSKQLAAWAPIPPDLETWAARLAGLHTILAAAGSELAGFISYERNGHIEFLYTMPGFERRGVASLLYQHVQNNLSGVEQHVQNNLSGVELFTEASLVAKPFFLRQGFHVVAEQSVIRRGVAFRRFAMRKAATRLPT